MTDAPRSSRQITPISPLRAAPELRPPPLPRPLTPFIGREQERRELTELLTQGDAQLVTLIGPAGVGKSRLALQTAADVRTDFTVVGFASLATIIDPASIVPAAGDALGIREPSVPRIGDQLAGLPALLVLDNLEQIPGAAGILALLLATCASLVIIATSRAVLRVSGERVYPVRPFPTDSTVPSSQLADSSAVRLFAERAQAADPTFTLDPSTLESVARICQQLDGLPLAIELAAGQTRMLSPQAILTRIDQRFELLSNGPMDQPERLRSLERAIRWSYDLLSPDQQQAFRRLGVFSGGFSEDAARQVALDGEPAFPLLTTLVDASLVLRTVQPDGESRYGLLESIRAFCLLELQAHGKHDALRDAHAAYYLQLAARAEPRLIVIGSAEWVRRLAFEHANLRSAVEWSLTHNDPEPVLALGGTLLSMAYAQGEPAESGSWLERAIALAGPEPTPLLSDARFAASAIAQVQGDFPRSVEHATRSLEIARAAGYPFGEGRALLGLGISAEWDHDLDVAEQRYRAASAIMRTIDPSTRLAHWRVLPIANLADIALIRRDYREAIELGSEAVAAWREVEYLWGIAQALGTVAAARCELGDLVGARRDYRETLELWLACADGRGIAGTIAGIAAVALHDGDPVGAATLLGSAWNARQTLGLEFVAHHLYAEQVRAAVLERPNLDPAVSAAEATGRAATLDASVAAAFAALDREPRARRPSGATLSAREREVLGCIMEGLHDREIADRLSISPRTVQSHVLGILNKLGAHSRAEAVAITLRTNLL
jgi:predicted ATPase/DNA-binding CsgD family transcriptional regulator